MSRARILAATAFSAFMEQVEQLLFRMDIHLGVDALYVGSHRVHRQELLVGDVRGAPALSQVDERFQLALRKTVAAREGKATLVGVLLRARKRRRRRDMGTNGQPDGDGGQVDRFELQADAAGNPIA